MTRISLALSFALCAAVLSTTVGCQTPSAMLASKSGQNPEAEKRRWTDVLRPRASVDKVDVPVWDIPDKEPDVAAVQVAYAKWMEQSGNATAALESYEKALDENPESVAALTGLARLQAQAGKVTEAAAKFETALAKAPNDPEVLDSFGQFELQRGRLDAAARYLQAAVEADPGRTGTRYSLAVVRARQGRLAEARTLFIATVGEAEAHYNLGMLLKDSRPLEAAAEFRSAMAKKPSLQAAQQQLAQLTRAAAGPVIMPAAHKNLR